MSVTPDDPFLLPPHRKPERFGGHGPDPVWKLEDTSLPHSLDFRATKIEHGQIEPAFAMSIADYQAALAGTVANWAIV